jgi:shikimate kinase
MKVILVGYMGSGKSSVGKLLASKLRVSFYDLDTIIEENEQQSVTELFENKGEIYFRKLENTILKLVLQKTEPFVLSLGGGTPCYHNNHEMLLQDDVVSFYLKGNAITLANRLQDEKVKRPLLSTVNENELIDFINKHLFDRSFYYHQVHHVISIDEKSVEQLVDEIDLKLR